MFTKPQYNWDYKKYIKPINFINNAYELLTNMGI